MSRFAAASFDLMLVTACYLFAVLLRVGGRLENASSISDAAAIGVVAALLQVVGNALVGAYRPMWRPSRKNLIALTGPALLVAVCAAAFNLLNDTHPIPYASLPVAAGLSWFAEVVVHSRMRWAAVASAIADPLSYYDDLPSLGEPDLDQIVLQPSGSIRDAIEVINRDVSRIALVTDAERRLLGVVTDGDVRRAILAGHELTESVAIAMTREPIVASPTATTESLLELMHIHSVRQIPLVDNDGTVLGVKLLDLLTGEARQLCQVVIMAGGLGTRLGVITRDLPKPLVRVGGRPVLELLLRDLAIQGFRQIIFAVNYKASLIEGYFGDGSKFNVEITYVREEEPLGTAGALRLAAPLLTSPFMVMNADLVTRVSFREMLSFHKRNLHDMTIGVIESTLQLRYGLVETTGSRVIAIREKPSLKHFVNAGIYVVDPKLIELVPAERRFDMDALITSALGRRLAVGCFPIHEYWTDIGEPDDLARATSDIATGRRRA